MDAFFLGFIFGFAKDNQVNNAFLLSKSRESIFYKYQKNNLLLIFRIDRFLFWSSYKGLTVDTLAHRGDEGRGYLR